RSDRSSLLGQGRSGNLILNAGAQADQMPLSRFGGASEKLQALVAPAVVLRRLEIDAGRRNPGGMQTHFRSRRSQLARGDRVELARDAAEREIRRWRRRPDQRNHFVAPACGQPAKAAANEPGRPGEEDFQETSAS